MSVADSVRGTATTPWTPQLLGPEEKDGDAGGKGASRAMSELFQKSFKMVSMGFHEVSRRF